MLSANVPVLDHPVIPIHLADPVGRFRATSDTAGLVELGLNGELPLLVLRRGNRFSRAQRHRYHSRPP